MGVIKKIRLNRFYWALLSTSANEKGTIAKRPGMAYDF